MCLCVRENIVNVSPLIFVMLSSVWCICWVLAARILARSAWYRSKVWGQPAGTASWWRAEQGGLPIIAGERTRRAAGSKNRSPQSIRRTDTPVCPPQVSGRGCAVRPCVCNELSERKTKRILTNKGPMFSPIKCLLVTGEGRSRQRERFNFRSISSLYTYSLDHLQTAIYRGQLTLRTELNQN